MNFFQGVEHINYQKNKLCLSYLSKIYYNKVKGLIYIRILTLLGEIKITTDTRRNEMKKITLSNKSKRNEMNIETEKEKNIQQLLIMLRTLSNSDIIRIKAYIESLYFS